MGAKFGGKNPWSVGVDLARGGDMTGVSKVAILDGKPFVFEHFATAVKLTDPGEPEPQDDCVLCAFGVPRIKVSPVALAIRVWERNRLAWVDGEVQTVEARIVCPSGSEPAVAWIREAMEVSDAR